MPLRRYSPPIERVKEEYARAIARARMRRLRGPQPPRSRPIPDNSEPWIANPKSVEDLCTIADGVQKCVNDFLAWGKRSANFSSVPPSGSASS